MKLKLLNYSYSSLVKHQTMAKMGGETKGGEATDHFKWIPTGLFYDLYDPANEIRPTTGPVNDAVSGFTNGQMFNAFQSGIYTLGDYRLKLIQQNPSNPTVSQVTNLFTEYHN
jgi:hypothetical protein